MRVVRACLPGVDDEVRLDEFDRRQRAQLRGHRFRGLARGQLEPLDAGAAAQARPPRASAQGDGVPLPFRDFRTEANQQFTVASVGGACEPGRGRPRQGE
ncbi:MAG: hypothetical protein LC800_21225 [Acidobacteria bacterium]|nr:hypothetical protein [Acidobacteriota bacterium]